MIRPQDPNNPNSPEQVFYFINNAQGTPVIIQNSSQQPVAKINLNEWGVPGFVLGQQEEINFTGKKLDRSTGFYYFNQRYYDPEIGRFLTEDPAGQTSNPYLFCGNNPMMYVDPDGETFFEIFTFAGAVMGAYFGALKGAISGEDVGQSALQGALTGVKIGGVIV